MNETIALESTVRAASRRLAITSTYDDTLSRVAVLGGTELASACAIDMVESGTLVRRAFVVDTRLGISPDTKLEAPHPDVAEGVGAVLRAGTPLVYERAWFGALARDDTALRSLSDSPLQAIAIAPLVFDGLTLGVMSLGFLSGAEAIDVGAVASFAQSAAVAIANARLLEEARRAQREAEASRARLDYVSRTSTAFARSLDRDETFARFVDTMVGEFADAALLRTVEGPGVRTKSYRAGVGDEALDEICLNAIRATRTSVNETRGAVAAPMVVAGRTSGAVGFARAAGREPFGIDDLTLLEDLAARAAAFLETATAFEREQRVSLTLQSAFRPRRLPSVSGLTFAAAYQPGTADMDIGGDWYDVIVVSPTQVACVIGDVMGHDVEAAAVMAEVRNGLRAHVAEGCEPGTCLARIDGLLSRDRERTTFATAALAMLDLDSRRLVVANAGHPPPMLVRASGEIASIVSTSPPLGLDAGVRPEIGERLEPGDTLLLFTDGVVEDRTRSYVDGIEALARVFRDVPDSLDEALAHALGIAPSSPDDRTVLAMRVDAAKRGRQ